MEDTVLILSLASLAIPTIVSMIDLDFTRKNEKDSE